MAKNRDGVDWRGYANIERHIGKSSDEKDAVLEKACTSGRHFIESGAREKGDGNCGVLRAGTDILADPPKFVTEGEVGTSPTTTWTPASAGTMLQ